jgi:hypothetical protein
MWKPWKGNDKTTRNRNGEDVIVAVKVKDRYHFVHGKGQNKMSFNFCLN